ncbi:MAG: diguanylate cyclase [Sutterellaceae bacterium]|nr:sensor domain-containing diguanylate cyclase [Burkholderiaceae bacterium]MCX7901105.1 sensor domain-containing diguanylate cyclase [Burkholderiaceae bacterium]MDW8428977.1 diguanylate cyclase [Sutterellaceae bacterium]
MRRRAWSWRQLIFLLAALLRSLETHAEPVDIDPSMTRQALRDALQIFVDASGSLSVADVSAPGFAERFKPPVGDPRNLGHIHAAVWIRFTLRFAPGDNAARVLELAYPFADSVQLYTPQPDGSFAVSRAGDHTRVSERALPDRVILFPIATRPGQTVTYYLRYQSVGLLSLPLTLWRDEALRAARQTEALLLGIYYGCLLTLLLYNLALFAALRARVYLAYVVYTLTMILFMATQNGLANLYLFPELPQIADKVGYLAAVAAVTTIAYFVRCYLATGVMASRATALLRALYGSGLALLAAIVLLPRLAGFWGAMLYSMTALLVVYAVALHHWIALRSRAAAYVAIAITLPACGGILLFARNVGIFPVTWLTEHGLQLGTMFEMLVLSLGLAEQVAVIRREREEARRAAAEDRLTGLANRAHLEAALPQFLSRARRGGRRLGVLWIDIDELKPINDCYGHAAGDAVLRAAATRMRQAVRAHDLVARIGGDEFVIVAEAEHDGDDFSTLAARLNASLARPVEIDGVPVQMSASIGIAVYPLHADNAMQLLALADRAMYAAKAAGRNTYRATAEAPAAP